MELSVAPWRRYLGVPGFLTRLDQAECDDHCSERGPNPPGMRLAVDQHAPQYTSERYNVGALASIYRPRSKYQVIETAVRSCRNNRHAEYCPV